MSWAEISIVFFVSHLTGDFLIQTDHQAKAKWSGLSADPVAREALVFHLATYMAAFIPVLIWIGLNSNAAVAVGLGLVIAVPHLIVDDGRVLAAYIRKVKGCPEPVPPGLTTAVDQSVHVICLWATALLAAAVS